MMPFTLPKRLSSLLTLCLLFAVTVPVSAQQMDAMTNQVIPTSTTENLEVMVGDILEILPTSDIAQPVYSWILTQDRTFIQAGRSETFRYRFIQPGTYSLIAEIHSADQTTSISRVFAINAKARNPGDTGIAISSASSESGVQISGIVKIDPPMDTNQHVILGTNQQLVKLTPLNVDVRPLALDVDLQKDSNADGNPQNDVNNIGSFFQLYAEPLYVWYASPIDTKSMLVTTLGPDGAPRTQQIDIQSLAYAQSHGTVVSPITIMMQSKGNGVYDFSAQSIDGSVQTTPLVYQWTFGDGQESLVMNTSHTYAADGMYTVTLQVRNLIDGQSVASEQQQVQVEGITSTSSSTSSAVSSTSPSAGTTSTFPLMTILMAAGIFFLFAIVGGGVVFLFSRLRGGKSLDQTFAEMEKTIVSKDDTTKNPAPLTIPAAAVVSPVKPAPSAPAPTKEDVSRREENADSTSGRADTPRIDEKAAPDWLKKGLDSSVKTPTPATSSQTAPVAPQTPPAFQNRRPTDFPPNPSSPETTPAPANIPIPTPPWLQNTTPAAPAPVATKPAAPIPSPAPVTPQAPKPQSTPAAPNSSEPKAPVPAWLQQSAPTPAATITTPQPEKSVMPKPAVTSPAPKPTTPVAPVPAWLQQPTPAPATPAAAPLSTTPAQQKPVTPQQPQQSSAPVVQKPAQTQVPVPKPHAPIASVSTPVVAPKIAPTPVVAPALQQVQVPKPAPTPSQQAVPVAAPAPQPVTPKPAPQSSVPPPQPKATPAPVPPVTPPQKIQAVNPVLPPKPIVAPVSTPVVAPKIAPAPIIAPAPQQIQVPKPLPVQSPVSTPKAFEPAPAPVPTNPPKPPVLESHDMEQTDLPIAIIRADSLDNSQNTQS